MPDTIVIGLDEDSTGPGASYSVIVGDAVEIGMFFARIALAMDLVVVGADFFNFAMGPYTMAAAMMAAFGSRARHGVLAEWLRERGVTPECLPEYVLVAERLELGPGGKTDRRAVRSWAEAQLNA